MQVAGSNKTNSARIQIAKAGFSKRVAVRVGGEIEVIEIFRR